MKRPSGTNQPLARVVSLDEVRRERAEKEKTADLHAIASGPWPSRTPHQEVVIHRADRVPSDRPLGLKDDALRKGPSWIRVGALVMVLVVVASLLVQALLLFI
ncbi:hypothetical protein GCM10010885_08590 [Alicyclobacillus cellulosilyticus]|uniref:Uncharacterized protein n=1 Tax=Alicyclobacillus cellulosilyticus TaxID=1003997 RepID=A0A917NHI8_9BACL|nr:hypothetical protein [Alicyclobacillus cellulosilyticus]GGJ01672.1 hypothetical protein GCM10010885_08590 [Alicyclobacillus cellulosilyticus]